MSRLFYRILASGALMAAITTGAFAQAGTADHDHEHGTAGDAVCGTILFNDGKEAEALANTKRNNPELYQRMVERSKSAPNYRSLLNASADDDIIFPFFIRNRVSGQYDEIQAKLVFSGKWARIWVDTRDSGKTKVKNIIKGLARGLDTATGNTSRNKEKGIIENDQEVFGMPPVNKFDPSSPIQDFLLTDIEDGMSGGFVGGFFAPYDQSEGPGSNKMNLLYIDANQGVNSGLTSLLSTLAHEFQHLIHYRTNPESETVFNEGCSEVASILLGYKDRLNRNYLADVNVSLFKWNNDDLTGAKLEIDYQRGMTLMHYMTEQYGEEFLKVFVSTRSDNMDRVADALRTLGRDPDWQSMLGNYVAANYLGTDFSSDPKLSYRTKLWNGTRPQIGVHNTFDASFPTSGSMVVQQYAGIYNVYNNPGGMKVKFKASQPIRVMAILYKGTAPVEVWQLENDQEYTIAQNGSVPYDKVVFAIANLAFNTQTVNWVVDHVTLGVGDESGANGGSTAISEIAPNPAAGSARVTFRTAESGVVNVDLYNPQGELVQRLVDGDRYEAGEHAVQVNTSELANGIYMVRVMQHGAASSRVMVVMNK